MYESETRTFSWFGILRKILLLIILMILIFGLTYFCSNRKNNINKNDNIETKQVVKKENKKATREEKKKEAKAKKEAIKKEKETKKINKELKTSVKQLENASIKYYTVDKLPTKDNETKTITLNKLIKNGDLKTLKTESGKKCDKNKSKVTIKKVKDKYLMTTTVVSGKLKKTTKSYVGCFSNCINGKICRGTKESQNGVCSIKTKAKEIKDKTVEKIESTTGDNITPKESTQNNTNSNSNSNTTSQNNNSNSGNSNNNTTTYVTPQKPKITYYEYQRCITEYYCEEGSLTSNNECVVKKNKTYIDRYGRSTQSSVYSYFTPKTRTTCTTTWSTSPSLSGWTRTGKTKVE